MVKTRKLPLIEDFHNIPAEALVPPEEQPYPIPAHWKWVRLGAVASYTQRGKGPRYSESRERLAVSQKCVRWSGLDLAQARGWNAAVFDGLDSVRRLRDLDILWNSTGTGTLGRVAMVPLGFSAQAVPMAVDSHVTVIRTIELMASEFLFRYLSSFGVQHDIEDRLASGTTNQKELNLSTIVSLPVPLAPLEEQQQIVTYLDEKLRKIDSVREKLQGFLNEADARKAALIQAGVTGHLTARWREQHKNEVRDLDGIPADALVPPEEQPYRIPAHWKWVRPVSVFSDATDSKRKLKQNEYLQQGQFPVVDQGKVLIGGYSNDPQLLQQTHLPVIVFGDHTRIVKYIDFPFIQGADGTKVLKTSSVLASKYLYYWLANEPVENLGYRRHYSLIKKAPFPLPPLEEQKEIARILDTELERMASANELVAIAVTNLDAMKRQLVSAALAGKLPAA